MLECSLQLIYSFCKFIISFVNKDHFSTHISQIHTVFLLLDLYYPDKQNPT